MAAKRKPYKAKSLMGAQASVPRLETRAAARRRVDQLAAAIQSAFGASPRRRAAVRRIWATVPQSLWDNA